MIFKRKRYFLFLNSRKYMGCYFWVEFLCGCMGCDSILGIKN
jgi:hypothetical protein